MIYDVDIATRARNYEPVCDKNASDGSLQGSGSAGETRVGNKLFHRDQIINTYNITDNIHISDINTSPQTIYRILKKLKTNSAAGPDGLPPIFYHHTAQSMSFPLSIFFRTLIETHSIPDEWRRAIITPKFKKRLCLRSF